MATEREKRERERERDATIGRWVRLGLCGAAQATLFEAVQPIRTGAGAATPLAQWDRRTGQPTGWETLTTADGVE